MYALSTQRKKIQKGNPYEAEKNSVIYFSRSPMVSFSQFLHRYAPAQPFISPLILKHNQLTI